MHKQFRLAYKKNQDFTHTFSAVTFPRRSIWAYTFTSLRSSVRVRVWTRAVYDERMMFLLYIKAFTITFISIRVDNNESR